jgi:hypothetical protein
VAINGNYPGMASLCNVNCFECDHWKWCLHGYISNWSYMTWPESKTVNGWVKMDIYTDHIFLLVSYTDCVLEES